MLPTQQTTAALCVRTQKEVSGKKNVGYNKYEDGVNNHCGFTVHVPHCLFSSDWSDIVVKLCFNLHMHLAQGQFTHLTFFPFFFFFFSLLAFLKNHTVWQLQLVLWQNAVSSKVLNFVRTVLVVAESESVSSLGAIPLQEIFLKKSSIVISVVWFLNFACVYSKAGRSATHLSDRAQVTGTACFPRYRLLPWFLKIWCSLLEICARSRK